MVCLHGQAGGVVEPVRTFFGQGGGVRTSFIDGPLQEINLKGGNLDITSLM